ncbi:MAG: hypothetical protein EBT26_02240 [Microbacteriaceae bacterium]|nr:hypothetical protein [Microbacteriaceae bacterium]NBS60862.1 hypothetical protein [Microbacteriaceae bacterium]
MNPAEIKRLLAVAEDMNMQRSGRPEAFLLQYIAWEALKIRILIAGMVHKGLTVKDAKKILKAEQVWNQGNYKKVFKKYFGSYPSNAKGMGKYFNAGEELDRLRHAFVHGTSRVGPESYRKASSKLIEIFEADWGWLLSEMLKSDKPIDPMNRLHRVKR